MCGSKYFWYGTFDFLWPVWALQMCLFMIILRIFVNIAKCCVVVILRLSIFSVYRLFTYFTKVCAPKITIFFHFFQTIASCDHQSTSGHLAECPFSLLFAILPFSYDFSNKNICKLNILISLLSTDRYSRLLQSCRFDLFW